MQLRELERLFSHLKHRQRQRTVKVTPASVDVVNGQRQLPREDGDGNGNPKVQQQQKDTVIHPRREDPARPEMKNPEKEEIASSVRESARERKCAIQCGESGEKIEHARATEDCHQIGGVTGQRRENVGLESAHFEEAKSILLSQECNSAGSRNEQRILKGAQ